MLPEPKIFTEEELPEVYRQKMRDKEIFVFKFLGFNPSIMIAFLATLQRNRCLPNFKYIVGGSVLQIQLCIILCYSQERDILEFYDELITRYYPYDVTNIHVYHLLSLLTNGYMDKTNSFISLEAFRVYANAPLIIGSKSLKVTFRQLFQQTGKYLIISTYDYNSSNVQYLSVLTTPDLKVNLAAETALNPVFYFQPKRLKINSFSGERYYADLQNNTFAIDAFLRECSRNWIGYYLDEEFKDFQVPESTYENTFVMGVENDDILSSTKIIDNIFFGKRPPGRDKIDRSILETIRVLTTYIRLGTYGYEGPTFRIFSPTIAPTPSHPYRREDFVKELKNYYQLVNKTFLYIGSHEGRYPTSDSFLKTN